MNSNKKQGFRFNAEHIEQILIQNTSTVPVKGTLGTNDRNSNAIVESQTTGPGGEVGNIVREQAKRRHEYYTNI